MLRNRGDYLAFFLTFVAIFLGVATLAVCWWGLQWAIYWMTTWPWPPAP